MGMNDGAAKPSAPESPLAPGDGIRRLLRTRDRACLATGQRDRDGWPYASLVLVACDHDASPLLMISTLADHTKNLLEDSRASLLLDATAGLEEPLTGTRATVMGRLSPTHDVRHRDRYLARHPSARAYAGFGDFAVWRMEIECAHIVAGFGRIDWVDAPAIRAPSGLALEAQERDVVDHMNEDHADAIALYAEHLLGLRGDGWLMTGCDPEGADLRRGGQVARLAFDKPVGDAEGARVELVRLVKRARRTAGTEG